jgi:hypothetical protein
MFLVQRFGRFGQVAVLVLASGQVTRSFEQFRWVLASSCDVRDSVPTTSGGTRRFGRSRSSGGLDSVVG